jgi:hypothetical protein
MKNFVFVLLIMSIASGLLNGQPLNVNFGSSIDNQLLRGHDYVRLVGADSDGIFAIRMDENEDLFLEFFDSSSKMKQSTNQLVLPSVNGIQANFIELFYLDGKLILFTEVVNNTLKQKDVYVQYINESGKIIGDKKLLTSFTDQNIATEVKVELTRNKQNIFIHYFRPFAKYNEEPYYFRVLGSDLEMKVDKAVKLPLNNLSFDIINYELHKNGNVYMLAVITPEQRRKRTRGDIEYQYKLLVYNIEMKTVESYDIRAAKYTLQDVIMGVDDDGNADIYGLMSRKNKEELEGIYHEKFLIEEGDWMRSDSKKGNYTFDRSESPYFRNERVSERYDQIYNYVLRDVLYLSSGGSVVIAEHENYWVDSTMDPQSKQVVYYDYHKFNDILMAYTGPDNNMQWMRRIPKSQWSYNDYGKYSSFYATTKQDWVMLYYNDNKKNIKNLHNKILDGEKFKECRIPERIGVPVVVSVFTDGDIIGYEMLEGKHKKYKIVPEMIKEFNETYYFYTKKSNKVQFGSFEILLKSI